MKSYKQSSLLLRNEKELDFCFMIIDSQNESNDLYYFYKGNEKSEQFKALKGAIMAITGISNGIFYSEPHIITHLIKNYTNVLLVIILINIFL